MRTEDIIEIRDGSFNVATVGGGKLQHICDISRAEGSRFRVLAVGGRYPSDPHWPDEPNDLMVVDVLDPTRIVYTQERFCRVVQPKKAKQSDTAVIPIPAGTKKVVLIIK